MIFWNRKWGFPASGEIGYWKVGLEREKNERKKVIEATP